MKLLFLLLFSFFFNLFSFSQIKPYVKTKTGEITYYDQVKVSMFKGKVICIKGESKDKIKNKVLESAVVGSIGQEKYVKQILFLKLKGVYSKTSSSVEQGRAGYEVMIKNGENMIVSINTAGGSYSSSPGIGSTPGVTTYGTSSGGKTFYFIEGQKIKMLLGFEWFTKEFLQKLINSFENCKGAKEIFENYYNAKGKLFKLSKMIKEIQSCYLNQCFEI